MKQRFTYLSNHATKRLVERTNLSVKFIKDSIDFGFAVDSGTEPIFNKKHWLIYDQKGNEFFFAIQDLFTGMIITILTVDYHKNLAWNVEELNFSQAKKNFIKNRFYDETKKEKYKRLMLTDPRKRERSEVFLVQARFLKENGLIATKTLFKLDAIKYNFYLKNIEIDHHLQCTVEKNSRLKGISFPSLFEVIITYQENKYQEKEFLVLDWHQIVTTLQQS